MLSLFRPALLRAVAILEIKLPGIVKDLLSDKERLASMRKNARDLAIYDAASRICDEVKALVR